MSDRATTTALKSKALQTLIVVAVFSALTAAMTYPQVRQLRTAVAAHDDPLLSIWRLSWIAHQLPRDPAHLFDGNIFHPERRTLAFTDAVLLPGVAVAPLHWLGVSPILIYNLVLLSGFVLSGAAMYLLVVTLTSSAGAAWLAGIVFAFAPYRFGHYEHLELQLAFWMPLGLWAMHRTLDSGRVRDGLLTGAIVAAQALSSLYYGIFFGIFLAVVSVVLLLQQPRERRAAQLVALAAGAVLVATLVFTYTIPYFANRNVVGVRTIYEVGLYSASPRNYLAAPAQNLVYGWTAARFGQPERYLFPGLTVLLLAIAANRSPARWQVVAYTVGLFFAFDASLGLNGISYSLAHHALPVLHGLRAPARYGILVCLSLAVLAGYGAASLLQSGNAARQRRLLVAGASALMLAEYATTVRLFTIPQIPSVYAWLRREPRSVVAELPVPRADNLSVIHDGLFMYFSTTHWQPLLNGYSGFYPPSYIDLIETMRGFPDDKSIDILRQRGVDYLIVHGRFYTPDEFGAVIAALEARRDVTPVGRFGAPGGESRVYRLRPTSAAVPGGRDRTEPVVGSEGALPTGS